MVPKRNFGDLGGEEYEFPVPESKRKPLFKNVAREVMRDGSLNEKEWENFFRGVIRDELENLLVPYLRGSSSSSSSSRPPLQIGTSPGVSGLRLHFINKMPSTIFTGSRVESEDRTPPQIVLRDAVTHNVVCSGPLASVKIEVLVLNSEFGADDQEDWTEREFSNGVVKEREGKRPLVTGEVTLNLKDGMCSLTDITFTDNSSWIRSRKFRLAARVVSKSTDDEVRIREARSEAFVVKDHRGELYKKHYPPALNDEIWRLKKIAKDGAFHTRLFRKGITCVRDLLRLYMKDQSSLRICFGSISNKTWSIIMEHALTCEIDEQKLYAYERAGVTLIFNSIYKLVAAIFEDQLCSVDQLAPHQKVMVENLKLQAYRNEKNMVQMDASAVFSLARPSPSLQVETFNNPNSELQQIDYQFAQQDEQTMQLGFHHASPSTSYPYQAEGSNNQFMVSVAQPMLRNSFSMEELGAFNFNPENTWSPIVTTAHLGTTENFFPVQTSTCSSANPYWGQGGFCFGSSSETGLSGFIRNSGNINKTKACWCKLRAAIKWWVSIRARRMARPLYLTR